MFLLTFDNTVNKVMKSAKQSSPARQPVHRIQLTVSSTIYPHARHLLLKSFHSHAQHRDRFSTLLPACLPACLTLSPSSLLSASVLVFLVSSLLLFKTSRTQTRYIYTHKHHRIKNTGTRTILFNLLRLSFFLLHMTTCNSINVSCSFWHSLSRH